MTKLSIWLKYNTSLATVAAVAEALQLRLRLLLREALQLRLRLLLRMYCTSTHDEWKSSRSLSCSCKLEPLYKSATTPTAIALVPCAFCLVNLLWCPLKGSNTNLHFPYRSAPYESKNCCAPSKVKFKVRYILPPHISIIVATS